MAKKQHSQAERLLTEVELELMNIIWTLNETTVKEVSHHLKQERKLAYTTVATVMRILEQKGFLTAKKDNHAHIFEPKILKHEYERTCLDHIVTHVFDGKSVSLVQRLLESEKLTQEDINKIEQTLQKLEEKERLHK